MSIIAWRDLTREQRLELAGRPSDLPKAKFASEPFYFDGHGPPPAPDGTKISHWYKARRVADYYWEGWWTARAAHHSNWPAGVYRIREATSPPPIVAAPDAAGDALARLAGAAERIADALENLLARGGSA